MSPEAVPLAAELQQIIPAVESGFVTIVENQACCVIANQLNPDDTNVLLTKDQLLFARRMASHFSARAMRAQKLGREDKYLTGVEGYLQPASAVLQAQLLGPGRSIIHH